LETKRRLLLDAEKEKLVDTILDQEQQIEKLRQENDALRNKLEKIEKILPEITKRYPKRESKTKSKPPSKWGRKAGHTGCTRPTPDHIDREVEQSLSRCPNCMHKLGSPVETVEHIQEDIIPARVEVTRFKRHRYWCSHCQTILTAPYAPDQVPCGYLGPRTLLSMVLLKFYHGLPGNKIRDIFHDFCGLTVSEGAITQALQRLASFLKTEKDVVLQAIREAAVKHGDETGWKINGVNHWLWAFVNDHWAFFDIHRSRGSRVPIALIGSPYKGILITDFFNAYDCLTGDQQKCLVHLRREIRRSRGNDPPDDFLKPERKFKRLLSDALRLGDQRAKFAAVVYKRRVRLIHKRFVEFGTDTYSNKDWQRLSKRVLQYENEILRFLDIPGLPSDNNPAERMIRPHVIIRNRSFQNRTINGAIAHSTLTSLIHSLRLQNKQPFTQLQTAYLHHRQGNSGNILFN